MCRRGHPKHVDGISRFELASTINEALSADMCRMAMSMNTKVHRPQEALCSDDKKRRRADTTLPDYITASMRYATGVHAVRISRRRHGTQRAFTDGTVISSTKSDEEIATFIVYAHQGSNHIFNRAELYVAAYRNDNLLGHAATLLVQNKCIINRRATCY